MHNITVMFFLTENSISIFTLFMPVMPLPYFNLKVFLLGAHPCICLGTAVLMFADDP